VWFLQGVRQEIDIFHACIHFFWKTISFFMLRIFRFPRFVPMWRRSTPFDLVKGTWLITIPQWAIYATVHAKFNRNLKLIDTSSQEGRSPFCQLPAVLTQSRITGRPNVKVFNGSTPYRRAIRWKRERARSGEKDEREYGGGNRGGMECGPPFLLFRAVYFSRENSVA